MEVPVDPPRDVALPLASTGCSGVAAVVFHKMSRPKGAAASVCWRHIYLRRTARRHHALRSSRPVSTRIQSPEWQESRAGGRVADYQRPIGTRKLGTTTKCGGINYWCFGVLYLVLARIPDRTAEETQSPTCID